MHIKNVHFIGKVVHQLDHCDSTNTFAFDLLSKQRPKEGTAILTFNQTKGRGQQGTSWQSAPYKNIATSIILYPTFLLPNQQSLLSQMISLAVKAFFEYYLTQKKVFVKWPNDIYVENKKIAGILIQNQISSKSINTSVIGIGINVNQESFSNELARATSLALETNNTFDLQDLSFSLFSFLDQYYQVLQNKSFEEIHTEYLQNLYLFNQWTDFESSEGEKFLGKITNVDQNGHLVVETNGMLKTFSMKEIRFFRV
ncbi:MAG: biotin--[acetyl-CoA-carboxylase] ligase [Bacteroidota bacterium]